MKIKQRFESRLEAEVYLQARGWRRVAQSPNNIWVHDGLNQQREIRRYGSRYFRIVA